MKKIIILFLLCLSAAGVFAQAPIPQIWPNKIYTPTQIDKVNVPGISIIPRDTVALATADSGAIAYRNGNTYVWNGYKWKLSSGGSFSTDSIPNANSITRGLLYPDLYFYYSGKVDSVTISHDTVWQYRDGFDKYFAFKLPAAGTTDTASLSARIDGKAPQSLQLHIGPTTQDLSTDRTFLSNVLDAAQVVNGGGVPRITRGVFANRSSYETTGTIYIVSDSTNRVSLYDGAVWKWLTDEFGKIDTLNLQHLGLWSLYTDAGGKKIYDKGFSNAGNVQFSTRTDSTIQATVDLSSVNATQLNSHAGSYYLDRGNHTGTQSYTTISGLAAVASSGSYADLSARPNVLQMTKTSHGFTVGTAITLNSSGVPIRADTTTFATGIVSRVIDANTFEVVFSGMFTWTGHGLTVGSYYYVTMPAGAISSTSPTKSQPVLYVADANTVVVNIMRPHDFTATGGGGGGPSTPYALDSVLRIGNTSTRSMTVGTFNASSGTFTGAVSGAAGTFTGTFTASNATVSLPNIPYNTDYTKTRIVIQDTTNGNVSHVKGNFIDLGARRNGYVATYDSVNDIFYLTPGGGGGGGTTYTVGSFDGQSPDVKGIVISGASIYAQSASATVPGMVNTTTQTIAGNKTLSGNTTISGTTALNNTVTASGTVNLTGTTYADDGLTGKLDVAVQDTTNGKIYRRTAQWIDMSNKANGYVPIWSTDHFVMGAQTGGGGGSATDITVTRNATNVSVVSSTGNDGTLDPADATHAGALDTARAKFIDSLRNRLVQSNVYFANGLTAVHGANGKDSVYQGGAYNQNTSVAGGGFDLSLGTSGSALDAFSIYAAAINMTGVGTGSSSDDILSLSGTTVRKISTISASKGGVPTGGTANQVLSKNSSTNYDYSWVTPSSGFSDPMTTVGDIIIRNGSNATDRLAGNTTTTMQVLASTGTGSAATAAAWHTMTKGDIGLSAVENTALSTWAGSSSITTLGPIATGSWNATAIPISKGGTGLTSVLTGIVKGNGTAYSAASAGTDYYAPGSTDVAVADGGTGKSSWTVGSIPYASGTSTISEIAPNTTGTRKFLQQTSTGAPTFIQPADADVAFSDVTTGNVSTSMHGYTKKLDGNATHYYDGSGNWSTPASVNIATADLTMNAGHTLAGANNSLNLGSSGSPLNNLSIYTNTGISVTGAIQYAESTNPTDANYSASLGSNLYILPAITANRTLTISTPVDAGELFFWNKNTSAFSWNVSSTLKDAAGNTVSSLANNTFYDLIYDPASSAWIVKSASGGGASNPASSSTYSASVANQSNATSVSSLSSNYMRIGNRVHVWGSLQFKFTSNSTATVITISVPFSTATSAATGSAVIADSGGGLALGSVVQDGAGTGAVVQFTSFSSGGGGSLFSTCQYQFDYIIQ